MYSRINMEIAICDDDELFNEIMSEKLSTVVVCHAKRKKWETTE